MEWTTLTDHVREIQTEAVGVAGRLPRVSAYRPTDIRDRASGAVTELTDLQRRTAVLPASTT